MSGSADILPRLLLRKFCDMSKPSLDGYARCSEPATILLADRAYDFNPLRLKLEKKGVFDNIRPMPNRVSVPAYNRLLYRKRNPVERFFNKLKHFRAVAKRYDKDPENYLAGIKLASIRIWLRFNE